MEKEEKYLEVLKFYQDNNYRIKEQNILTKMANLLNLLKEKFQCFHWIGFYLLDGEKNELYLGPFIGSLAANSIALNRGVCGYCARKKETIVVEDVSKFDGHIACSLSSRSEICVPLIINKKFYGLLDIDSNYLAYFDQVDKKYLELLVHQIFE